MAWVAAAQAVTVVSHGPRQPYRIDSDAAAAFAIAALASYASAQQLTVRIGFSDPVTTPWGKGLTEFKRIVESESNGRIKVQLFPSEQLDSLVEMVGLVVHGCIKPQPPSAL